MAMVIVMSVKKVSMISSIVSSSVKGVSYRWSLEKSRNIGGSLLVVCPKCGRIGRLYYNRKLGWYIKHGSRQTHSISKDTVIEIPLHEPRLNLIHYMGGDTWLLPYLARMMPPHYTYVVVFGGGAPLLLNKAPSNVEVYNDIDGDLVNLFRVVKERYDEFMKELEWILYSRQLYYEYLEKYRYEQDHVKRAAIYFLVIWLSFNGIIGEGFRISKVKNEARSFFNVIDKLRLIHRRLKNVVIEQLDFRECIRRYDSSRTFFYLDPPHLYYATEKDKRYYREGPISGLFSEKDYMEMLALLTGIKGYWLIKQNYIPYIIEWAKKNGYDVTIIRIAKRSLKVKNDRRETMQVVFVSNYKLNNYKR